MKLMHPLFSHPIMFRENNIPVLTIENTAMFRELVFELIAQSESLDGRFVLSHRDQVLDCANCLHVIQDYAHIHAPDKKLQSRLLTALVQQAQEELAEEGFLLHKQLQNYLGSLAALADYPVAYDESENLTGLLKAMEFRVDLQDLNAPEALAEHIGLYHRLLKNQCFVLIHAKQFFTVKELQQLYTLAQYQKWNLLLVESSSCKSRLYDEAHTLFDTDLCELTLDHFEKFE